MIIICINSKKVLINTIKNTVKKAKPNENSKNKEINHKIIVCSLQKN